MTDFTYVRGVLVSRSTIERYEQDIGGHLIPDSEWELLLGLDDLIFQVYRKTGKVPPKKTVQINTDYFIFRDIPVDVPGLGVIEAKGPKKMWFRRRRIF